MDRNALKNLIIILTVYSLLLIFIGRQLSFIPQIKLGGTQSAVAAEDLKKNIEEKLLKDEPGSYSIYYKDLNSGAEFGIDEHKLLTAASVNKLPIAAYLYSLAYRGKINLEDTVVIQKDDIQDYGTGFLRYQKPGGVYTLKDLTKLALEQSDNTAAHVLGVRLDASDIQKYINSLGLSQTNMVNNKTSAADMGKLLDLIYTKKIAGRSLTFELLDFMSDTDFEDRLARDIPKSVNIYHKAGDGVGFVHDVGIIDDGKNLFILSIMTNNISDEEKSKETIGKIAKYIYDQQTKGSD